MQFLTSAGLMAVGYGAAAHGQEASPEDPTAQSAASRGNSSGEGPEGSTGRSSTQGPDLPSHSTLLIRTPSVPKGPTSEPGAPIRVGGQGSGAGGKQPGQGEQGQGSNGGASIGQAAGSANLASQIATNGPANPRLANGQSRNQDSAAQQVTGASYDPEVAPAAALLAAASDADIKLNEDDVAYLTGRARSSMVWRNVDAVRRFLPKQGSASNRFAQAVSVLHERSLIEN